MEKRRKEPEARYQRSCNHNYLVLQKPEEEAEDYQTQMLLENRIGGLLPMERRECEGREEYYYEISSLQPILRVYEHKELGWEEVRTITEGILDVYDRLQEYLLDDSHVVLEPEQIYQNLDDHSISLLFWPFYRGSREESFLHLAEYFLDRIDHRDTAAAMFAYRFYKIVRRDNFVPEDLRRALSEPEEAAAGASREPKVTIRMSKPEYEEQDMSRPESRQEEPYGETDPGDEEKSRLPVLSLCFLLAGLLVAFGLIPGIRSGSTRPVTAALLIVVGVVSFLLLFRGKRPPRNPDPAEIFPDPMPGSRPVSGVCQEESVTGFSEDGFPREKPREDPFAFEEDEFGKTVFYEPEKETLLCILKEKGKNTEYPMRSFPFTIGKVKDCVDLALPDRSVSRIHARIVRAGEQLCLQDCRSTNGTFLNGMRLEAEEQVMLEKGDEVGIGKLRFELV